MTTVFPLKAFKDNYIWIIKNDTGPEISVVDPGDASPVLELINQQDLKLTSVLITHHHWDHTGGIAKLSKHYADLNIYGPAQDGIDGLTHPLKQGDKVDLIDQNIQFEILEIPGHTLGHIAYHNNTMLFSGDTLFACGCGRVFEGTFAQMYNSLRKLHDLDDELDLYCGHEYTLSNLEFALSIEPDHSKLQERLSRVRNLRNQGLPSLPCKLKDEKQTNPFFRCHDAALAKQCEKRDSQVDVNDPVSVFTYLRKWKDNY